MSKKGMVNKPCFKKTRAYLLDGCQTAFLNDGCKDYVFTSKKHLDFLEN